LFKILAPKKPKDLGKAQTDQVYSDGQK